MRVLAVIALLIAAWATFALLVVPWLIGQAYRGESLSFLNDMLAGRDVNPLSRYLGVWRRLALRLTVVLGVTALASAALFRWRSEARVWLRGLLFAEPALGADRILAVGAGVGLAAGVAEIVVWRVRVWIDGFSVTWSNIDSVWAAPLLLCLLGLVVASPLAVACRLSGRRLSAATVIGLLAAVAWFGILKSARAGLTTVAIVALAAGLGSLAGRFLTARRIPLARRFVPAVVASALAFVLLGATMVGGRAIRERVAMAGLPPATADAPSIVFIILDTVRASSLSVYGYERETTPALTRFGSRGVIFERAIAPAPWTLPSHASVFTGMLPWQHGANWRTALDDGPLTLAEFLRERGYATGGFVANLEYTTRTTGIDRGFVHFDDYALDARSLLGPAFYGGLIRSGLARLTGDSRFTRKNAPEVGDEAIGWIDRVGDRPFFVFMNYYDAHGPYELHEEYVDRLLGVVVTDTVPADSGGWEARPERAIEQRDRYDTSLAFLDSQLEDFFEALDARGMLDNTLVVITADHGELFGEHGLTGHGKSLYDEVLHVPLIIVGPDLGMSGRVGWTAALTDLPTTVVRYLGVDGPSPFGGSSLLDPVAADSSRFAVSEVDPNPWVEPHGPVTLGSAVAITSDRWRMMRYGDGSSRLYDLRSDPSEVIDLSRNPASRLRLLTLGQHLDSVLGADPVAGRRPGGMKEPLAPERLSQHR